MGQAGRYPHINVSPTFLKLEPETSSIAAAALELVKPVGVEISYGVLEPALIGHSRRGNNSIPVYDIDQCAEELAENQHVELEAALTALEDMAMTMPLGENTPIFMRFTDEIIDEFNEATSLLEDPSPEELE